MISVGDTTVSDGYKATYSASMTITNSTTTSDIWGISGSATKTVRVLRIGVSLTKGSAALNTVLLIKKPSVDTGGTPTNPTIIPFDSNSPAATAVVVGYAASPTGSASTLVVRSVKLFGPTTAPTRSLQNQYIFDFSKRSENNLIINGTSESVVLNLNGVAIYNASSLSIWVEWVEE